MRVTADERLRHKPAIRAADHTGCGDVGLLHDPGNAIDQVTHGRDRSG
jgi:hypothetical protein